MYKTRLLVVFCSIIALFSTQCFAFSEEEIVSGIVHPDWHIRYNTVAQLVRCDDYAASPCALIREYDKDGIKQTLIGQLEREWAIRAPGEDYAEYLSLLVSTIAGLKDQRATSLLLGKIYFGFNKAAEVGVARMGDGVAHQMLNMLTDEKHAYHADTIGDILGEMLRLKSDREYTAEGAVRTKIKSILIEACNSKHVKVRLGCVKGLKESGDSDALSILEKIAKEDTNASIKLWAVRGIGGIGGPRAIAVLQQIRDSDQEGSYGHDPHTGETKMRYPVRREAEEMLKKIKEKEAEK